MSIDVHHHFLPPDYIAAARERILKVSPGYESVLQWTPEKSLAAMDAAGIATAVLSISTPGIWFDDDPAARKLARLCNEYAAGLVRDHPGHFGFFAAIPLPDREGSFTEIDYALGTLKADGIGLLSSYGEKRPGDPAFAPVLDELNRRKAVVYVHPTAAPCCAGLVPELPPAIIEFPFDTTRAIASLLYSGSLARCPDIRFIFSHGGGTLPMLADRISRVALARKDLAARVPGGVIPTLRKLFVDTASVTNPGAMAAVRAFFPGSQVLLGSDYPWGVPARTVGELHDLGLAPAEVAAIERGNALALFPRLGA